jgi:MoxR-like ATPase
MSVLHDGTIPVKPVDMDFATSKINALIQNIETIFFGKHDAVKLCVVGLLARGHVLIEDIPGIGKTTLAQALARSIDCTFNRIQFTSDMLPSDILGVSVLNARTSDFEFREGPIFANVVLADEVNRTPPKTQSALLEAMSEFHISVEGKPRQLPKPFLVLATQNPIEYEGTYTLPEAQLDRFLLRVEIGYPGEEDELRIMRRHDTVGALNAMRPVLTAQERGYVTPGDVKLLSVPVLSHRILVKAQGGHRLTSSRDRAALVQDLVSEIAVPK